MIASRLTRNRKPGGHHRGHGMPALVPMIDAKFLTPVSGESASADSSSV